MIDIRRIVLSSSNHRTSMAGHIRRRKGGREQGMKEGKGREDGPFEGVGREIGREIIDKQASIYGHIRTTILCQSTHLPSSFLDPPSGEWPTKNDEDAELALVRDWYQKGEASNQLSY